MDSMSGSLHLASTEAGFEVVLEAPLTQLKRRLGDASQVFSGALVIEQSGGGLP